MGRRKTKKIVVRPKPKIPTVFVCPGCGKRAVKVDISLNDNVAEVKCGACKAELNVKANALTEPVDAYGEFVDAFKRGEIQSQNISEES